MVYVDIPFPKRIAMGAQRRAGWKTTVVQTASGHEATDQQWSRAKHRFDVGLAVRAVSDFELVQDHFHSVRGRAKAFPFWDAVDNRVDAVRGVIVETDDSPTTLQLAKRYGTGDDLYARRITRPKSGTVAIYRERTGVTTNVTGSATIDYSGGGVVLAPGVYQADDVLSWSGQFYVPCRYDTDDLPSLTVNRQPGTDGELLVTCDSIAICEVRE